MPEGEVSLVFAEYLLGLPGSHGDVSVAIDGAQVRVKGQEIFPIETYLLTRGWKQSQQVGKNNWQGIYFRSNQTLKVHATSGEGDVVAFVGDKRIRAESKGGPLIKKSGSKEYPILRELIGQLVTIEVYQPDDILIAVVPSTERFKALTTRWRDRPIVKKTGIDFALVNRNGTVSTCAF
ncbi:MAG: hypothetical protein JJ973_00790 [Rhodospirillales bacterium]|nr:hypothetical protein [Rhodospirillales bacterium]